MCHERTSVQIEQLDGEMFELRYFDTPECHGYRSWKLSVAEAADLTAWWTSQGRLTCSRHLPIRCLRTGGILVSMFTLTSIEICGLDSRGKPRMQNCSLPREVVEVLAQRLTETQTITTPLAHEAAEACSKESL